MSKSAFLFLTLTVLTAASLALSPLQAEWVDTLGTVAVASFSILFFLALAAGRKIKFDPVLR
ncbi:PA3371 family protein [Pseudomonas sp. RIT-PI-AD]|uniref:PA3371 family protein n=1 Tax=Pseudomonas sp. RIT-PI-AD TaxID=3035294 RepID=UPI0021D8B89D|nr:PA3371 family protein [Pseudomonas sp. RIT-PI-AD]